MKYRILIDYHSEGMKWASSNDKESTILEFETVDEAVKAALSHYSFGNPFLVVQMVDWEANKKTI